MNRFYLAAALVFVAFLGRAQSPSTGGPTPTAPVTPADPTEVPLDGGASVLLASGVAYGLRRLRRRAR
ncbi:MAG: PID-CTERM protein-sorting domain-containing protein [Janthinobacterium lividum]